MPVYIYDTIAGQKIPGGKMQWALLVVVLDGEESAHGQQVIQGGEVSVPGRVVDRGAAQVVPLVQQVLAIL